MPTEINITVSEFQSILTQTPLPADMQLTISFKDEHSAREFLKKRNAVEAMKRLRGTGNGNPVSALLRERAEEARQNLKSGSVKRGGIHDLFEDLEDA